MKLQNRKAFTMLELIFVIVIIGILSAVAIPKFAMNRDDAIIAKAKNTVAAVRNAVATERQKRILRGNFKKIEKLSVARGNDKDIFDGFDGDIDNPVLEYPLHSCKDGQDKGCWRVYLFGKGTTANPTKIMYRMPVSGVVKFKLANNRFDCLSPKSENCIKLTR